MMLADSKIVNETQPITPESKATRALALNKSPGWVILLGDAEEN